MASLAQIMQSTAGGSSVSPAGTQDTEVLREMTNAVAGGVEEADTFDMGFITFNPQNAPTINKDGKKTNAWIAADMGNSSQASNRNK